MQFKVVKQTDITAIETMRESELRLELANWNEKYKELNVVIDITIFSLLTFIFNFFIIFIPFCLYYLLCAY